MIVYPVRRAVTSFIWFVAALVGLYGVTLAFFWWFALPTILDFQIMTALLGGGVLMVGAAGFVAYRMRYIYPVSFTHLDVYKRQVMGQRLSNALP